MEQGNRDAGKILEFCKTLDQMLRTEGIGSIFVVTQDIDTLQIDMLRLCDTLITYDPVKGYEDVWKIEIVM